VFREDGASTLWGRSRELGEDGIGATLSGPLSEGEVVSMEISVPIAPHLIKVRAVVRYCNGLYCGFEFLVLSSEQRQTLRRVCESVGTPSTPV